MSLGKELCVLLYFRERKQAEEDARLGIVRTEDSDDGDIGGDPFKRVDVEELKKKVMNNKDAS